MKWMVFGFWKGAMLMLFKKKGIPLTPEQQEQIEIQDFLDMICPSTIKFFTDYYICGNTYRSVWAIREYPTETNEQGILRHLGEKDSVTLKIYTRYVTPAEERKIISNAANRNKLNRGTTTDLQQSIVAETNLQDVATLIAQMHRNKEPLLHTAVYIEIIAYTLERLREQQTDVEAELLRSKLNVDKLFLRQQQGFVSVIPTGYNAFGIQFERVLPASSVANFYPFNYSGKTDPRGFFVGRDKCGSNVVTDFNKRADDKTNGNILVLGNSGQGKSYLIKLILTNLRQAGMKLIVLDAENEYCDLTHSLGGCYLDMMSGQYLINLLEPRLWDDGSGEKDDRTPEAFTKASRLSQHISFLRDFWAHKDFSNVQLDTLQLLTTKLYQQFHITNTTDFDTLESKDYPILSDLYAFVEKEYMEYNEDKKRLYTAETLQELCLGLHSMCVGAESKFFNGHTNITNSQFITFGVRGLLEANKKFKDAVLFNILSYMSHILLTEGNAAASIDELYLFLSNITSIEYIRNLSKRSRKKDSLIILGSQNLEDYNLPGIAEYTKPLFSIPTHQFLFNAGTIDSKFYMDTLQLEKSEFELIRYPQRGTCLYKCGNERYHLQVMAPEYKAALFGKAGGR